jgi:hypothetical protein
MTARTPGGRLKSAGEKMTRISTLSIIGTSLLAPKNGKTEPFRSRWFRTAYKLEREECRGEAHQSIVSLSTIRYACGLTMPVLSLLTLKLVISKLADVASKRNVMHVPYRDSKL